MICNSHTNEYGCHLEATDICPIPSSVYISPKTFSFSCQILKCCFVSLLKKDASNEKKTMAVIIFVIVTVFVLQHVSGGITSRRRIVFLLDVRWLTVSEAQCGAVIWKHSNWGIWHNEMMIKQNYNKAKSGLCVLLWYIFSCRQFSSLLQVVLQA